MGLPQIFLTKSRFLGAVLALLFALGPAMPLSAAEPTPEQLLQRALRASTATVTVSKRIRLHFTWFVYRGDGEGVEIDPPQVKPWEDTRPFANSPWAISWVPPEGGGGPNYPSM